MGTSKITVGTGLIVTRNNEEILLVMDRRRKLGGRREKWGIIGGTLEENLTFEDNARKEALEETGYQVRLTGLVGVYQHVEEEYNRISIIYKAEPLSKVADPLEDEIEKIRWFSFDEIPFQDLRFAHNEQMIRDALEGSPSTITRALQVVRTSYQ